MGKAKIFCNEIYIDKMARGTVLTLIVASGQYKLQTDLKKDGILLQAEPKKEYYIDISPNTMWGGYYIKKVDPSEAKDVIMELPEKKKKEILFTSLKALGKKPSKTFFSKAFLRYLKYSSIVSLIIAFIVYLGISRTHSADEGADAGLVVSVLIFIVILVLAAALYYPVLFISKLGWKYVSSLFGGHFGIGVLYFLVFILNIWVGWLINATRDLSGAYERSRRGYWATKDGNYYMSAKKWETGEWIAPMKAIPKLILWNLLIIVLSLLLSNFIVNISAAKTCFFLSYSSMLLFLWLFYFAKYLKK